MKKKILIYNSLGEAIFLLLLTYPCGYLYLPDLKNSNLNVVLPFIDEVFAFFMFVGPVIAIIGSFGYYEVSGDVIVKCSIPFIPFDKIKISDYQEIGLVTRKSYHSFEWTVLRGAYRYTDYIYFSDKVLAESERDNYEAVKYAGCKIWPHNKKLHTYLTDTLGIELKGELRDKK